MSELAGELSFTGAPARLDGVHSMISAPKSQGIDDPRFWSRGWVAFGHRRLKIIDLSDGGAQPMTDDQLGIAIIFDGTIYNYRELREELSSEFRFQSESDTEVIIKAYAKWGEAFVDHLLGAFAIALFDEHRNQVVLARDRLGIKPLYYSHTPDRLRFASTLPALLAAGDIDTSLDPVGLHHYISWHSIVPAPRTLLKGVHKLPAATVRVIEHDGMMRDHMYWSPDYSRNPDRAHWSEKDWGEALHTSLRTAVQRCLVADVPVGVTLSGGLDSSLIVALLDELGEKGFNTFSIGFDSVGSAKGDEFEYSDLIAKQFGTDHQRLHVPGDKLPEEIPRVIHAMSEPMASHDVTAFYLLSRAVAEHITVAQSGQGADELFAGYRYHQAVASADHDEALERFTDSFRDHTHAELREILQDAYLPRDDASSELLQRRIEAGTASTALDAVLELDAHTLMIDDPVKRVDSMTRVSGLEARVPFLDHEVVELAAQCPPELKTMQGGKGILKELGRALLPNEVIDRPKGYFPLPELRELSGGVLDTVREALTNETARQRGVFRRSFVDELLERPNAQTAAVGGNPLWSMAVLEMWLQEHNISTT